MLMGAGPFEQSQKLVCVDDRFSGPFCEVTFPTEWLDFETAVLLTIDVQQTDFSDEDEYISAVKANTVSLGSRYLESGGQDHNCLSVVRIMDSQVIPHSAFGGAQMVVKIETTPRIGDVRCGSNTLYAEVTMHQSRSGPDINGVYVVPFRSTPLAGPLDFELTVQGSRANNTYVPINLHVTTNRPAFKSDPVAPGLLFTKAQKVERSLTDSSQAYVGNVICASLTVNTPHAVTCGPPQEVRKLAVPGVEEQSEGWWTFFYMKVGEMTEAKVYLENDLKNETGSNCSARVYLQDATAGAAVNITKIQKQSGVMEKLRLGGASNRPSSSLLLSPADAGEVYIAVLFPGIARADISNTSSRILRSCNSSVRIRMSSWIQNLSLDLAHDVLLSRASQRLMRMHVHEAAYYVISIVLSGGGNAAVYLSPETSDLPTRQLPPAANRRVEAVGFGPSTRAWNEASGFSQPFELPSLVLSPDDEDFKLQDWIIAVFADAAANLSVSVARVAIPPTLQLFRDYSLTRPAAALFEWRIPCHTIVGQAVTVSFTEISDKSAQECPLSMFARYLLPPTQESWIAAAGREGGRSSMVVPSKPAEGQQFLFFAAMRCPGGYRSNTTHCIRLEQCSHGPADQYRLSVCANTSSLSAFLVAPPMRACSFRLRLSTQPV